MQQLQSIFLFIKKADFTKIKTMRDKLEAYWKANLRILLILLVIWFVVGLVFPILLVDQLNTIQLGGFKLGFWFAFQGSIIVFVILLFVYANLMNRLDKQYGVED